MPACASRRRFAQIASVASLSVVASLPFAASTVAAPQDLWPVILRDTFSRSVAAGWGAPRGASDWQVSAAVSAVDGSAASLVTRSGADARAVATSRPVLDGGLRAHLSIPSPGSSTAVETRVQANGQKYAVELTRPTKDSLTLGLVRTTASGRQGIGTIHLDASLLRKDCLVVELRVVGTDAVVLHGRAWAPGAAEPGTMLYYVDRSGSRVTAAGSAAVSARTSASGTGAATVTVDNVEVFSSRREVNAHMTIPTLTPEKPISSPTPTPTPTPRYLLWVSLSFTPTEAEVRAAAGKYSVVILNSFMSDAAKLLRSLDPNVKILFYLDLSSTRSYDGANAVVTGTAYTDAVNKGWLALDSAGQPVTWGPYAGHYQTAVWNTDYQAAWVKKAVELANTSPWDGVFADNDMITLRYYTGQLLAGTRNQAETDAKLTAGLDGLIRKAGPALQANSKILVPNIGDSRLRPNVYTAHGAYGGGLEEMYLSWSSDYTPDIYNWGAGGWTTLRDIIGTAPRSVAITQSAVDDRRTQLYGYATFLLRARPGDAWTSNSNGRSTYPPEAQEDPGTPVGPCVQVGAATTRTFTKAWVAVNPNQTTTLTVPAPAGAKTLQGVSVTQVTLAPMSGTLLRR